MQWEAEHGFGLVHLSAVESVPGKSVARGFSVARACPSHHFENLEDGMTIDEIMEQFELRANSHWFWMFCGAQS